MKKYLKYTLILLLCVTACCCVACGKKKNEDSYQPVKILAGSELDSSEKELKLYKGVEDKDRYFFGFDLTPSNASWKDLDITISDPSVVGFDNQTLIAKKAGSATVTFKAKLGSWEQVSNVTVTEPFYKAGSSYYDNLTDLTKKIDAGFTITLYKDIVAENGMFTASQGFTMDLNNHTITSQYAMTFSSINSSVTIKNGKLKFTGSEYGGIANDSRLKLENVKIDSNVSVATILNKGSLTWNNSSINSVGNCIETMESSINDSCVNINSGTLVSKNGVAVVINSQSEVKIGTNSNELSLKGKPAIKVMQGKVVVGDPSINSGNSNTQILVLTNAVEGKLSFEFNTTTSLVAKLTAQMNDDKTDVACKQDYTINKTYGKFAYDDVNFGYTTTSYTLNANSSIVIKPISPIHFDGTILYEFDYNDNFQFRSLKDDAIITPTAIPDADSNTKSHKIELSDSDGNGFVFAKSASGEDQIPSTFTILATYIPANGTSTQITITVNIDLTQD